MKNKRFHLSYTDIDHAGAAEFFRCDFLSELCHEFAGRFGDFKKLEPSVNFIANTFMDIYILFSVSPMEMEGLK